MSYGFWALMLLLMNLCFVTYVLQFTTNGWVIAAPNIIAMGICYYVYRIS